MHSCDYYSRRKKGAAATATAEPSGCQKKPKPKCRCQLLILTTMIFSMVVTMTIPMPAEGLILGSRPLSKRAFFDVQCHGLYNKIIFGKLDRVCDDCFNLYHEAQLYNMCRSGCFGSEYFKGCMDALLLNQEESQFDEMIEIMSGK